MRRSFGGVAFDTLNNWVLAFLGFLTLYPFWYILILSLNDGADAALGGVWFWPRVFSVENYRHVLNSYLLWQSYGVTIARTVLGSALSLFVTGFAAYALSKRDLPGRSAFITLFLIPMFIGGTIVTNFVIMTKIGLLNRFLVYIIPGAFSFFLMVIMRTYFAQLPDALEDSAMVDGAGYFRIFFRIVLPISMPIVATVILFAGVGHWLDFSTNLLYVTRRGLWVLQYVLYRVVRESQANLMTEEQAFQFGRIAQRMQEQAYTPESIKMATLVVVTAPILVVYPFLQKYFIKGALIGALRE